MHTTPIGAHAIFHFWSSALLPGLLMVAAVGIAHATDLVVTHIAPYSGPAASLGKEYGEGARLYFEYVNAQGGIYDSNVVLVTRDDAGDPELTRRHAGAAAQDKPVAFIGTFGADSINSLIPMLARLQAPLVGPVVDSAGVSATISPYVFHVRPTIEQEVEAVATQLHALGMRRMALCDSGDARGKAALREAAQNPAQSTSKLFVTARCGGDPTEIEAAANAIAVIDPQAVIFVGQTQSAALFIKTLRAKGSYAMVVVNSSVDPKVLVSKLPAAAAIWLAVAESVPNPNSLVRHDESIVREFLAMRDAAASWTPLSRASLTGFLAAKIAVEAIRRAGKNPTSADVLKQLATLKQYDVGGIRVNYSRDKPGGTAFTRLGIISKTGVVLN